MSLAVIKDTTPDQIGKILMEQYGLKRDAHIEVIVRDLHEPSPLLQAAEHLRREMEANGATEEELRELLEGL